MTSSLESQNHATRAIRDQYPRTNDFPISKLQEMPPWFDWVSCGIDAETEFQMFLGGNDDGVALRFFWNGRYEAATLQIWSHLARRDGIKIDIGAHIQVSWHGGCRAVVLAHHKRRATPPGGLDSRPKGRVSRSLGASEPLDDAPHRPRISFYRENGKPDHDGS